MRIAATLLLLLLLLLSSLAVGQQTPGEKTIEKIAFGGLTTKHGTFTAPESGSAYYHNLDPSRKLGSLNKRWGYSYVDSMSAGFDSITGIYAAYLSDGRQYLVYAADSAGVGYGGLYITPVGTSAIDSATRFWQYWAATSPTNFAMFDDRLYAMNGVQAGAVYDFTTGQAVRFPLQAPGEPIIVPLDAGTELDGEYRYMVTMFYHSGASNGTYHSVVSQPVRVSSGRVLLTSFPPINKDTICVGSDSVRVKVFRTLANPGRLEQTDTMFLVINNYTVDTASLSTLVLIDSIADSSVNHGQYQVWSTTISKLGIDTSSTYLGHSYGAPGYDSQAIGVYSLSTDSNQVGGIHHGIPTGKDTIAVAYTATFLDTLNRVESDTGRSIFVYDKDSTGNRHTRITRLSLPRLHTDNGNMVVNLYRSHLISVGRDTVFTLPIPNIPGVDIDLEKWVTEQNRRAGYDMYYIETITKTLNGYTATMRQLKMRAMTADTVIQTPYYLVKQVTTDSLQFTDSTRFDSLQLHEIYRKTPPSTRLSDPFTYNGRMFGLDGNNLRWSLLDSATRWGAFDFISVNKDDGDRITLAFPTRRSIRVFKNKSSYNVYQDGNNEWNLSEVTNGIGCIAPRSHALSPAGHYYLSQDGVILETEGDYLERTYKAGLISGMLDNFDKLPMSAKAQAVGFYNPAAHKYMLTVPIAGAADTTYIYDELAGGWATWSMPIGGAVLYDTESVAGYNPGNSMYFYLPNTKNLYRYGDSYTDGGAYIWSYWTSTPFLTDEYEEAVSAIGIWFDKMSSGDFVSFYDIVDGRDTTLSNLALFTNLGDTVGYREEAVASLRTGAFHQLAMRSTPFSDGTWSRIDKINVSYLPLGKRPRFGVTSSITGGSSGEGSGGTVTFGDITGVIAGYGLAGGGYDGDVTLRVDTTLIATKQFVRDSSSGGGGGGMTMDSTTAGDGLIEVANALAVRPGYGIDTVGDLVRVDSTEFASLFRLRDTAAAVRGDIRDTVLILGITDSSAAGDGLTETGNTINAVGRIYILAGADSLALDTANLRTWVNATWETIANVGKIGDDTTNFKVAYDSVANWDNGALDSTNLALGSVLSSEIKDGEVQPIDLGTGKFKIDAFYGDSTVADSHYTTIARLNKIADDTTALLAAKDSVADWDNGALDSTNLALGSVFSSEISDQTIKKDDIDSTASNVVFDDAYRGTSGVADSAYATEYFVKARVHDSLNGYYQTFEFTTVHGRVDAPSADSVVLRFPTYGPWLLIDSSYDDSKSAIDSFFVSGTIPITLTLLDSLIFTYKADGSSQTDSCFIDSIVVWGPDRSNGTNMCDSIWFDDATDRSSGTTARVAYFLNESTVLTGDRFAVKFRVSLIDNSTNATMRIGYVQMKGKR